MKGAIMIRNLLVLALGAVALPAHSMTASVTNAQQPVNTSGVPVGATASKSTATAAAAAAPDARSGAAAGKIVMPSAVGATQPAAVLLTMLCRTRFARPPAGEPASRMP